MKIGTDGANLLGITGGIWTRPSAADERRQRRVEAALIAIERMTYLVAGIGLGAVLTIVVLEVMK